MARMYPERLPRILTDDPMRAAEARVYSRLGDSLEDDFTVMHGVPWRWGAPHVDQEFQ